MNTKKDFTLRRTQGFTLIELIVTIAILAIILAIVVVAINPAEQISRSRDAKRVADLDSLRSAWNLYLAQATTTIVLGNAASNGCVGNTTTTYFISRTTPTSTGNAAGGATVASSAQSIEAGAGWAPARIDQTPGGAAIPVLPVDPKGTATTEEFFYAYVCNQTLKTFEFTSRLESSYFQTDLDVDGTDGGNSATSYEVGNDPALDLITSGK